MGDTFEQTLRYRASEGDIQAEEVVDILDDRDIRLESMYDLLVAMTQRDYNPTPEDYCEIANILTREDGIHRRVNVSQPWHLFLEEVSGE